jgi:hypothetical protein
MAKQDYFLYGVWLQENTSLQASRLTEAE